MCVFVGSVGRRFRTHLQPCSWKRIKFCGWYLCFSFTCMIQNSSIRLPELHRGKTMWMLIAGFPDEMWMVQPPKEEIIATFSKKKIPSRPIKHLACWHDMYPDPSRHQKIPIKWYSSIYFVSLVQKSAVPFVQKKNYWKSNSSGKRSMFFSHSLKMSEPPWIV